MYLMKSYDGRFHSLNSQTSGAHDWVLFELVQRFYRFPWSGVERVMERKASYLRFAGWLLAC